MLARAGKRLWQAFSTCPVAPHARRGDPPTVDLLVEVSDGLLHLSIDCIDAQADLQLVPRASWPDKLRQAYADAINSDAPECTQHGREMAQCCPFRGGLPYTWFVRR